jgi:hypothetical protein
VFDDLQLDQAIGEHAGRPGGPALGHGAASRGNDDRLGLAVQQGFGSGARLVVERGVKPAIGEPAADVGHGAERDAEFVGDLGVGLAGISP